MSSIAPKQSIVRWRSALRAAAVGAKSAGTWIVSILLSHQPRHLERMCVMCATVRLDRCWCQRARGAAELGGKRHEDAPREEV
mmetsp:Transcript_175727/g.563542  ORF Transcript_175727/g.563542 Transcript_175727/m.563542 type:complete len:83 (+) Transcript_175727:120-368(+)